MLEEEEQKREREEGKSEEEGTYVGKRSTPQILRSQHGCLEDKECSQRLLVRCKILLDTFLVVSKEI